MPFDTTIISQQDSKALLSEATDVERFFLARAYKTTTSKSYYMLDGLTSSSGMPKIVENLNEELAARGFPSIPEAKETMLDLVLSLRGILVSNRDKALDVDHYLKNTGQGTILPVEEDAPLEELWDMSIEELSDYMIDLAEI